MHSYKGHVKRLFINKTRKCATESMAQNEEACLLKKKKKKGCLGMPIPCYNSCRKQMEICHGPFKKISTLRIGEQYQSLSEPATKQRLCDQCFTGSWFNNDHRNQMKGAVVIRPHVMLCAWHGSTLKISSKSKSDSAHQIRRLKLNLMPQNIYIFLNL